MHVHICTTNSLFDACWMYSMRITFELAWICHACVCFVAIISSINNFFRNSQRKIISISLMVGKTRLSVQDMATNVGACSMPKKLSDFIQADNDHFSELFMYSRLFSRKKSSTFLPLSVYRPCQCVIIYSILWCWNQWSCFTMIY